MNVAYDTKMLRLYIYTSQKKFKQYFAFWRIQLQPSLCSTMSNFYIEST